MVNMIYNKHITWANFMEPLIKVRIQIIDLNEMNIGER